MDASNRRLARLSSHLATVKLDGSATTQPRSLSSTTTSTIPTTPTTPTTTTDSAIISADTMEQQSQHDDILLLLNPLLLASSKSNHLSPLTSHQRCALRWRLARAHERLWQRSVSANDIVARDSHVKIGLEQSKKAIQENKNSGMAHKWRAIYLGMEAEAGGVLASAKNAQLIYQHLRQALLTLPEDSTMHFMLGRTTYSCAGATWSERTAAKLVGYVIPVATFVESIGHFRRAQKYAPLNVNNMLWLGKAYLKSEKNQKKSIVLGRKWLNRAATVACVTDEDRNAQHEARVELKGLRSR